MAWSYSRTFSRFLQRLGAAVCIGGLAWLAVAVRLFLDDPVGFTPAREARLTALRALETAAADDAARLQNRLHQARGAGENSERLLARFDRHLAELRSERRWWWRWFAEQEDVRKHQQRVLSLEERRSSLLTRVTGLRAHRAQLAEALAGLEHERARIAARLAEENAADSEVVHYLSAAWARCRWYVLGYLLVSLCGRGLLRTVVYFALAPRVVRGRPVRLRAASDAHPHMGETGAAVEVALWPGDRLLVRPQFVRLVSGAVKEGSRALLDWRLPVTSLRAGLHDLLELQNAQAGPQCKVTIAAVGGLQAALGVVHVPEGGSIVVRPAHLIGLIQSPETGTRVPAESETQEAGEEFSRAFRAARPKIRRHWQLLRWPVWIAGQFRFCEFQGPCRLIVSGERGLHAEHLTTADIPQNSAMRRAAPAAVIGFAPNLDFGLIRAPRFWSYLAERARLFDAYFTGDGLLIVQEGPTEPEHRQHRRIAAPPRGAGR